MPDTSLKEKMLNESNLIIKRVDDLETKINKQLKLLEKAYNNDDYPQLLRIKAQVTFLLGQLAKEEENMDAFMDKYQKLITYEKKTLLSNFGSKKQVYLRGICPKQRRSGTS